jgi:hypothetical protein
MTTDPTYDLSYLSASFEELEAYLFSKELFWHITGSPHLPSSPTLSLVNLLLSTRNLRGCSAAGKLSPAQKTEYAQLERKLEEIHHKWTVAWQTKAAHEYQSRLRQWINYLNELNDAPENNAAFYSTEVRNRVLLELLKESSPESAEPDLAEFDAVIRAKLTPSDFIWDPELQSVFPQEQYWFLYGSP